MEKNHRFMSQSLKGPNSESKKSQDSSVKWPRHSKRREQPNFNGSKPENYRSNSNKTTSTGKVRQTNYNYEKRSKQRPETLDGTSDTSFSSQEPVNEYDEGTGLASYIDGGSATRHELHSVFSPGSKKQSLNHLLNFHYTPRERDQPARFSKTGNNRGYIKRVAYNKEQFLQASCQFVVRADEDYTALLASPDQLVDWAKIEQVHILSSEEPQCPICLYPPVAAKMTKCGHVYCWPCILHYLALSDKTWRKCPICYDAIHLPDLRSAVSKPFHSFATDEFVTFQLMRREKSSMIVSIASESTAEAVPYFNSCIGNTILTKLLLADTAEVLDIINREQEELDNQIVVDGVNCPENIFVQQALEQLKERKELVLNAPIRAIQKSIPNVSSKHEAKTNEDTNNLPQTASPVEQAQTTQGDFIIDEDNNFSLSDIDIVPTSLCSSSAQYYYFYQSTDGQPLYLHSINTRMLQAMYGSLDKSPDKLTAKIIHKDSCSMSEDLRKRLKYLQHLPVSTQFDVVEVEFEESTISSDVLIRFKDELSNRRKERQKRARQERIRERQIFEFNERQLGKTMSRCAKIPIDSAKHFPSCGNSNLEEHISESGAVAMNNDGPHSPPGPSWSMMLSTSPASSRWPTLPSGGSMNTFAPLAVPTQKVVQVTGTKMSAAHNQNLCSESDKEDDDFEGARVPEFRNDLSSAIEAALEKATLNDVTVEGGSKKSKATGTKKKKNKKTLLFASGMNMN